jgi:hypothetical protein
MSRFTPLEGANTLETLEQKLSPAPVGVTTAPVVSIQPEQADDSDPPPGPPISDPNDGPPIVYPNLPPSGPGGPG